MKQDMAAAESPEQRQQHNQFQADYFKDKAAIFCHPLPEEIQKRMTEIVEATGISSESCVLDVGTGTGALIQFLIDAGVKPENIVGCDLCESMLASAKKRYDGVHFWQGDIIDFPWPMPSGLADHIQGFDAVFFNGCFGNIFDQKAAIERANLVLSNTGRIVISHPLPGFVTTLHEIQPELVPHLLPDEAELRNLTGNLPLSVSQLRIEPQFYLAIIQRV